MARKRLMIVGLVTLIIVAVVFVVHVLLVGSPRRPMTEGQADALIRRGLPLGASVSQVKIWLDIMEIEHSEYGPHHADGADGVITSIIRDTHRSFPLISSDIQVIFTFDSQRRLMKYSAHEVLTGP